MWPPGGGVSPGCGGTKPLSVRSAWTRSLPEHRCSSVIAVKCRCAQVSPDPLFPVCRGASLGADRREGNTETVCRPLHQRGVFLLLLLKDYLGNPALHPADSKPASSSNSGSNNLRDNFFCIYTITVTFKCQVEIARMLFGEQRGGQEDQHDSRWCADYFLLERPWGFFFFYYFFSRWILGLVEWRETCSFFLHTLLKVRTSSTGSQLCLRYYI